jgi:hypothetical protein
LIKKFSSCMWGENYTFSTKCLGSLVISLYVVTTYSDAWLKLTGFSTATCVLKPDSFVWKGVVRKNTTGRAARISKFQHTYPLKLQDTSSQQKEKTYPCQVGDN